ncbi:MAG: hypothetical protein A2V70_08780 [Planctomycetes bacterium RBG_13_63_9]|nr:MAG: hypothetical protein A2V70_08780 [Planctomycetes bacterium RBG_13_63_9]
MLGACGQPCAVDWLMGVRYFRFKEHFVFGSRKGATWGANGGTNEAYLSDRITNDLIGFQMGCDASYHAGCSLRLFASPKFGIYHNRIDNFFQAYRGDGVVANPTAGSGRPEAFPVSSAKNVVSCMGQIDVGAEWQFANNWSARIGYRLVAVTDVGLADEQIPVYVVDIPEIASIDHNSNLILHGAFVGLTYNY